jgi:hypothetical protein
MPGYVAFRWRSRHNGIVFRATAGSGAWTNEDVIEGTGLFQLEPHEVGSG